MAWKNRRSKDDLGFGTRVRTGRGERLIERDGSFTVRRLGLPLRAAISLYHSLLVMTWPTFLGLVVLVFIVLNTLFASLYLSLGPEALQGGRDAGFGRAFFFSVHTASTIGYGHVVPATLGADLLVTVEAVVSLVNVALVTGLVFARFSRPRADIVFSKRAIVAPYRGVTAFEFRIADQRRNQVIELRARVFLSRVECVADGPPTRTFEELPLERDHIAFFPLTWTIVHPIDESSPLHGRKPEVLLEEDVEFLVTLTGIDETFSQTVHARSSYRAEEILWDARFANIYQRSATGRPSAVDISRIHETTDP